MEIPAAHHMRDTLHRIIEHNREVIARRNILPDQHDITPDRWIGGYRLLRALSRLPPMQRAGKRGDSRAGIKPQGIGPLSRRMMPAIAPGTGAGIEDRAIGIARRIVARRLLDIPARAGAAEREPTSGKIIRRGPVACELRGLPENGLLPGQAQPCEIREAIRHERIGAARRVDILEPDQESSAFLRRHARIEQGRKGMPQMQVTVGAGGEPENGLHADQSRPCMARTKPAMTA